MSKIIKSEFIEAFNETGQIEGGFANHPNDRGGMTFCGIARNFHQTWPGWSWIDSAISTGKDPDDLRKNPVVSRLVEDFYRELYWMPLHLEELPQLVANEIYDSAVNAGFNTAVEWMQHATNLICFEDWPLVEDGKIGPRTRAAVLYALKHHGEKLFYKVMNGLQFEHFHRLTMADRAEVKRDPFFKVRWALFFRGWVSKRIFEVM